MACGRLMEATRNAERFPNHAFSLTFFNEEDAKLDVLWLKML